MPHVLVELTDLRTNLPDVVQTVETDSQGRFSMPDVPPGEYAVGVHLSGFATASQNVMIRKGGGKGGCKKPITIQMQVAGRCSTVFLVHKQ
jgi:5-hydroxyisourate hydrolase-like protein (transthyretin family)